MSGVRIDKWLWSVRIFKTRTLASQNCKKSLIKVNNIEVKSSKSLFVDDVVEINFKFYKRTLIVKELLEKRVGAALAVKAYEDITPPEELKKKEDYFVPARMPEYRPKGLGRPTKRDRRKILQIKGRDI